MSITAPLLTAPSPLPPVRIELLTDDFPAGVLWCDGDSAGGTLAGFLQPHFHAGRTEHVVVGADDRLPDLHGETRGHTAA